MPKKFYITTPIYYVNDHPHIGHAYTTVAADSIARYRRLKGEEVFFLTGTDEHGSKLAESAKKAKRTPKEFCDEMSAYFASLWDALNISYDGFIRTTSERHKRGVKKFLLKLNRKKVIYKDKYEGLYCIGCERFITKKELVAGRCPLHNQKPQTLFETNYFFRLSRFIPKIERLIIEDKIRIMPFAAKREVLGLIRQGLGDFSISREGVKWGIKLPFDQKRVTYVWVEALQNYLTGIGYGTLDNLFKKFWPADVHLIGRDILKFHTIYWPALLLAGGFELPKTIFVHGFFTVNGKKMSKSLGNIIDPNRLIKEYGSDGTRYLLLCQFPFGQDGDVKEKKFSEQYEADLANDLGNLNSRCLTLAEKGAKQKIRIKKVKDKKLAAVIDQTWQRLLNDFDQFKLFEALKDIWKLIDFVNAYIDKGKPWEQLKSDQEKFACTIYNLLETLRHIAWMIFPFMPETSNKILVQLNVLDQDRSKSFVEIKKWGGLPKEVKVKKGDVLFPKL